MVKPRQEDKQPDDDDRDGAVRVLRDDNENQRWKMGKVYAALACLWALQILFKCLPASLFLFTDIMCWNSMVLKSMANSFNILIEKKKKHSLSAWAGMNMKWGSGGWSRGVMASSVFSLLSYQPFEENHQAISINVFNFTTRWHSCAPKCCNSQAFFLLFFFWCTAALDTAMDSIFFVFFAFWLWYLSCWGESEVVLKRHFSARLQSRKVLNQRHFALEPACVWKDQLPQPCAMCSIRYVIQIQVG